MTTSAAMVIRDAILQDMDAITQIYRSETQSVRKQGKVDGLGTPYYQADKDFIARQAAGENRYQIIVAEVNDRVVGYARALHRLNTKSPAESTDGGSKQTTLHKLGVLQVYQGKGIGTALMQAVIARASELGRTTIRITLPKGNPMEFYQKFGFEKVADISAPRAGMRPLYIIDMQVPIHKSWVLATGSNKDQTRQR